MKLRWTLPATNFEVYAEWILDKTCTDISDRNQRQ